MDTCPLLVIPSDAPKLVQTLHHLPPSSQIIKTLQTRAKKKKKKIKSQKNKENPNPKPRERPKSLSPIRSDTLRETQYTARNFDSFVPPKLSFLKFSNYFPIFMNSFHYTVIVHQFRDLGNSF